MTAAERWELLELIGQAALDSEDTTLMDRTMERILDWIEPIIRADEQKRMISGARWRKSVGAQSWSVECLTDRDAECPGCLCICHAEATIALLKEALEFYADPATYHAIAFWGDPPCGDFAEDFSEDHGDPFYDREMPGKTAREALAALEEEGPDE